MTSKNNNAASGEQNSAESSKHIHPLPSELNKGKKDDNQKAHMQADKDMDADPDLSLHSPNDDLDEGETARFGEDKTDLV